MQRYFVQGDIDNISFLEGDIFHIRHVMRLQVNEEIEVCFKGLVYLAKITSLQPFSVEIVDEIKVNRELPNAITLLYCLPKMDKLDLVVQKATELGVTTIVGVNSQRSIVKLDAERKKQKILRMNKIIKEASEQSKRSAMPIFEDIIDFKDIIKYKSQHNLIAYEKDSLHDFNLYDALNVIKPQESITVLVGAEGGFTPQEVENARMQGFKSVSLGKLILRSETAAIYFLSVLSFMLNRFEK